MSVACANPVPHGLLASSGLPSAGASHLKGFPEAGELPDLPESAEGRECPRFWDLPNPHHDLTKS